MFDVPCLWRDSAISALGLEGESVMAALSPGAAFPAALRTIASTVMSEAPTVVDVGAGAGGASEWLRETMAAHVIAIEPAAAARRVARARFPLLDVRRGDAERTGLDEAIADLVVLSGVASLIDDLAPVLDEASRLLRRPGHLAIADLYSADSATFDSPPNTFRSLEHIEKLLVERGFSIVQVGCGPTQPDAIWSDVAERVTRWITDNRAECPGFAQWLDDQQHLQRHAAAGDLLGGCVVALRH